MSSLETLLSAAKLSSTVPSGSSSAKKLRRRPVLPRFAMRSNGTNSERIVLPSPNLCSDNFLNGDVGTGDTRAEIAACRVGMYGGLT